jgi:hypothetical protein
MRYGSHDIFRFGVIILPLLAKEEGLRIPVSVLLVYSLGGFRMFSFPQRIFSVDLPYQHKMLAAVRNATASQRYKFLSPVDREDDFIYLMEMVHVPSRKTKGDLK